MSAPESELRRGIAVLDQFREQIEALAQQQEIIRISLEEHLRARETLTRYREAGREAEVLVPIGANSFLVAESKDVDRAFVSIGSDLLVYDEIPKQIERLEARIKSITDAANAIGGRLADMQRRAEAQGAAVQDLYDRIQTKGPSKDGPARRS
ncbi:MAG TPA: prefoldin subunit alpha [Thermoplasmata archaeon]|jgi:prefoldin alpha subunit|nr:prefoldin subunit alpha [Thermoplasmata archaeon]